MKTFQLKELKSVKNARRPTSIIIIDLSLLIKLIIGVKIYNISILANSKTQKDCPHMVN